VRQMQQAYNKINAYLSLLRDRHGVQICIKDYCGFISLNKELDEALQPFLAHTNPFCMYMKSDQEHYHVCLSMIRRIYDKSKKLGATYFGMCHAGLGEYVIPIIDDSILLGSINAGFFQENRVRTINRIERSCSYEPPLDSRHAKQLYRSCISTPDIDPQEMLAGLEVLAEYLGQLYHDRRSSDSLPAQQARYRDSSEDTILSHAIGYIRHNAGSHISVPEMAAFCHCSESYISHIFKKRTGKNINTYINEVRIELAKNRLLFSNESIAEISASTGFSEPNYFSRVFTKIVGMSPMKFRYRKN
jgi:AraC-like DNA-binding protein